MPNGFPKCLIYKQISASVYEKHLGNSTVLSDKASMGPPRGVLLAAGHCRIVPAECRSGGSGPWRKSRIDGRSGTKTQLASGRISLLHHWEIWNGCTHRHTLRSFQPAQIVQQRRSHLGDPLCKCHEQLRSYHSERCPSSNRRALPFNNRPLWNVSITGNREWPWRSPINRPILSLH